MSLIAQVVDKQAFFEMLNYLNMVELKTVCQKLNLPYVIYLQNRDGSLRRSKETDRKGIVLERLRTYLQTGAIAGATVFPYHVVRLNTVVDVFTARSRLYYGQYDKSNKQLLSVLRTLTNDTFNDGAIARIVLNEFWRNGTAPTLKTFANAWLAACSEHHAPKAEWAFLADRSAGRDTAGWKQLRQEKAQSVLAVLEVLD